MMVWLGGFLWLTGTAVLLVAALGVLRLPDALTRQHAATKAGTLALSLFVVGGIMIALGSGWEMAWSGRLLLLLALLYATLPLASHALARAAASEQNTR